MNLRTIKHYFKQFNKFLKVENFVCDDCYRELEQATAYSLARTWKELKKFPTYCYRCLRLAERELKWERKLKKPKKLDKRTLRRTGRTHQLGTRVRRDFLKRLRFLAKQQGIKYVEVLERALDCYEREVENGF